MTLTLATLVIVLAGAQAAGAGVRVPASRGSLLITFSGVGGGSYGFHHPADAAGRSCEHAETTYDQTDSYSWSYTFVVPPGGGPSDAPLSLSGSGVLASIEQTSRCGDAQGRVTSCTQSLRAPTSANLSDLAYPEVNVVASTRQITIGAFGELVRAGAQASCSGPGSFIPNLVRGYAEVQASTTFPRALLNRPAGYTATFSMGGPGLYAGTSLSGSCTGATCDPLDCTQDEPAGGSPLSSCSFGESYTGTIEVRAVR